MLYYREQFPEFCRQLRAAVPNLSLWAAGIWPLDSPPDWLTVEDSLTVPLRCPPTVQREVEKSGYIGDEVPSYSSSPWPAPTEGPAVRWLKHEDQPGHSGFEQLYCEQCGRDIALCLQQLGVGQPGRWCLYCWYCYHCYFCHCDHCWCHYCYGDYNVC